MNHTPYVAYPDPDEGSLLEILTSSGSGFATQGAYFNRSGGLFVCVYTRVIGLAFFSYWLTDCYQEGYESDVSDIEDEEEDGVAPTYSGPTTPANNRFMHLPVACAGFWREIAPGPIPVPLADLPDFSPPR